ncbi:MAG: formyltetrahydrofolate deformylase [Acidimicrobiales bacterium]
MTANGPTATLRLSCADQPGVVAAVSAFIARNNGNIIHAEQHTDAAAGIFFQRVEFQLEGFAMARDEIDAAFTPIATDLDLTWSLRFSDEVRRVAILCSRQGHCLYDLLGRWDLGEMPGELAMVVSNHDDHRDATERMGVPFHHLPVAKETKLEAEVEMLRLLEGAGVDVVVMARYMQILSEGFVARFPNRIINIHHSFLPAFPGGRPYHQAHARGVKLIGVTAHYATSDLDEGPIIEQDVVRVSHRDPVTELVRKGRDLEMVVLARAVRAHLCDKILVYGNKTVVFG